MEKIVGDWSTTFTMTVEEAKKCCKLGQGSECCAFLVMGAKFECIRLAYPSSATIFKRLEEGTMVAQGEGGWKGCAWEGEL